MDNKDVIDSQPAGQPESKDQSPEQEQDDATTAITATKDQEQTKVAVQSSEESMDNRPRPSTQTDDLQTRSPDINEGLMTDHVLKSTTDTTRDDNEGQRRASESVGGDSPARSKFLPMSKSPNPRVTDTEEVRISSASDDSPVVASKLAPPPASVPAPSKPQQQSVPNMTPGISNFLRQQDASSAAIAEFNRRKPQPDARDSHTAKAAIQNLAQQVRDRSPPTSEAPPPHPPRDHKVTEIIKEMKGRQDSETATAKAKSAAAAIHTIAYGVKSAVSTSPSKTDTNSSKDILMQRVMRQKAKKEIEKSSARHMAGYLEHNVVDLSQGSDELGNESETSRSVQGQQHPSSSVPAMFQPTRGQSTRNPKRWEGRGWNNGNQQQHPPPHHAHPQQQMHGYQHQTAHRAEAEKAAMLQSHLLHSIQTDQQQKQSHATLGSGWTAREAALIAESNQDTVQKILAAQSAPSADEKKKQDMLQQQEAYANIIARQRQTSSENGKQSRSASMGSSSGRGFGSNDPSQNDAAMATLVRKLLGSLPVRGDEPPVVLGPQLIASISDKLKQVINRMVDIQDERSGDKRKRTDKDDSDHNNRLTAYAQQQVDLVREQQMQMEAMQRQLDEKSAELADQRNEITALSNQRSVEDDPAIQNLLKQLETGMQTAARQKKEITALRAVINQDAADIQQKDDVIGVLRGQLEQNQETMRLQRPDQGARGESVTALREELKHLQNTLETERRQSETTTRAYMRAAVHALKVQNRALNEG